MVRMFRSLGEHRGINQSIMGIGRLKSPSVTARSVYAFTKALNRGFVIPLVYCVCVITIAYRQPLFVEFDGVMHYYLGAEIFQGKGYHGWGSHFWPPLYALLAGAVGAVIKSAEAGSIISALAASVLLYVVYVFVYFLSGKRVLACLGQLLVAVNHAFVLLSVEAENHMLDSLFYVLAIMLLVRALQKNDPYSYFIIGIVSGLAGLTRYTSYSLLPAFLITLICFYPFRRALVLTLYIIAGFALISSPWWVINYLDNGSPLATWQYTNVGAGVFAHSPEKRWWWWWEGIDSFRSVTDIMWREPGAYLWNFCRNVALSVYLIVIKGQLSGLCCIAAILIYIFRQSRSQTPSYWRTRAFLPVLICLASYIMLVSQAFVFRDVFLSWLVLVPVYGVVAIYRLGEDARLFSQGRRPAILMVLVVVIALDLLYSNRQLNRYMTNISGLEENTEIIAALKKQDSHIDQKVLMAIHPGRAFHLGSKFIMLPPYYREGRISELVTFERMSFKVRNYAPRYPSSIDINDLQVDYLVYDPLALSVLPQFSFLLQKNDPRIPANFQLVYRSDEVAVYKINRQIVHQNR